MNKCGHAYNHFIFPNPSDTCLKGKLCFKSLADINNSPLSSYIMFEVKFQVMMDCSEICILH